MAETMHNLAQELSSGWMVRPDPFRGVPIPADAQRVKILGIYYLQFRLPDGGDLYVTRFGQPYLEHLKLENWLDREWFRAKREKLEGTSTVYKVPSKEVNGRSVDLVVKWSRVGEDVPMDTMGFDRFSDAEFNTPFEEFSLLMEMRERRSGPRILTHRPLGIYVPPEQLQLWQTGRSRSRIARKKKKYRDVELDIMRQYILVYEWIGGDSAHEVLAKTIPDPEERNAELTRLTKKTQEDMRQNGFRVIDHKPAHVILRRQSDGGLLRERNGGYAYALVDFELLVRTEEYEKQVEVSRRTTYHEYIRSLFAGPVSSALPDHLRHANVFGVDYIWGHAESTHGEVWVMGKRPELFDFFLPERWRHTERRLLPNSNRTYHTISKDHIKLTWKVSRVGETPDIDRRSPRPSAIRQHGYNSPFEEFSLAMELGRLGFSVVYPRAIYAGGLESPRSQDYVTDLSRFESHRHLVGPDGKPVLSSSRIYITLWGYWMGPISNIDGTPLPSYTSRNLAQATTEGLLSKKEMTQTFERITEQLETAGFEALSNPSHYLLSLADDGSFLRDPDGALCVTLCNFERLLRRPASAAHERVEC